MLIGAAQTGAVFAQPAPQSIIGLGNGVVTGFSGTVPPPAPLPPGVQPADKLYIDPAGPSARVIDLQNMNGPPAAQLVPAPKPFTATAAQIGQVYAVALDNASPPSIYVAATSSYGLPIVVPDKDGDGRPDRVKQGTPGATFMPGLWGPAAQNGGPGSIWKIDGTTGVISLFANVTLDGAPNSGPALGGLAFDPATNQLFVADRDTGMIHRFTLDGVDRGRYDHGVAGRQAAGQPPVPFNPANRLDIANPAFNSENPATWQFAPPERLIYGLGVRGGRLFYAVREGLQVWSVSIQPDGALGNDARIEVQVPAALAPTEIAKIIFDDQGRMILGERGVTVGSYDFSVLAQESVSRVLRYELVAPAPGQPAVWQPVPDEYAIGFAVQNRNANGGVAVGYGYGADGQLNPSSCSGTLWSTGEQLRQSMDAKIAAELAGGGPLDVTGLQGNAINLVRPQNVPPQQSYFVDFDDAFDDPTARGHMGDIAIPRICGQGEGFGWLGGPFWFPPGYLPPDFELPPPPPPPPPGDAANLRLDKWALPNQCVPWGAGWNCWFRVRVTSTGPGPYVGPIVVSDWLPANPAGAIMAFGFAPWACGITGPTSYQCVYPGAVLNPGASIDLHIVVWVPNTYQPCNLANAAEIVWAPGGDLNPGDDSASAVATIPAKHCPPKDKQTNLKIEKKLLSCYDIAGPQHRCAYRVFITNTGPGVYNAPIHFTDEIPAGTTATFSSPVANPFTCAGGPPTYTCQSNNPVVLNPTDQTFVTVRIDVPDAQAKALKCVVRNEVKITQAPGGTPQNTNPADDTDAVNGHLPFPLCPIVLQVSNLRLVKVEPDGQCHAAGGGWQCDFRVRVSNSGPSAFNGQIQILDWLPWLVPGGTSVSFSSPQPWNCALVFGNLYSCTLPNINLAINQFTDVNVRVNVPLNNWSCQITNSARIIQPASPTLQNLNAADDFDSATAQFIPIVAFPGKFYCLAAAVHKPEECPPNTILNRATGQCVPFVGPPPPPPPPPPTCPPGTVHYRATSGCGTPPPPPPPTCPPGSIHNRLTSACLQIPPPPPTCPPGTLHNRLTSACVKVTPTCPPGQIHVPATSRCITPPKPPVCPQGQTHIRTISRCITLPTPTCPQGQTHIKATSTCIAPPKPPLCPQGQTHIKATSTCIAPPKPPACPQGQTHIKATSGCLKPLPPKPLCPSGQTHIKATSGCLKPLPPKPICPQGQTHVSANSRCIAPLPPKPVCPQGLRHNTQTSSCAPIAPVCPQGQRHNPQTSRCTPILTVPPRTLQQQQPQIR